MTGPHFAGSVALARHESPPERTAFVRFRRSLVAHRLDSSLFEAVAAQPQARAITVKTGTLVDATIIASATKDDDEGHLSYAE